VQAIVVKPKLAQMVSLHGACMAVSGRQSAKLELLQLTPALIRERGLTQNAAGAAHVMCA
jgi:hypothetical protein